MPGLLIASALQDTTVNLFETTIRILGGLLAAFHLDDHSPLWLDRALELGLRMTPALTQSPSGLSSCALRRHGQTQLDTILVPALCADLGPPELYVRCWPAHCVWVTWDINPVHDPGADVVPIRCDGAPLLHCDHRAWRLWFPLGVGRG